MNANETITNLETMSQVMSKVSNKPKFYNTTYGYYLEQMSQDLYRCASELREIEYLFGMTSLSDKE